MQNKSKTSMFGFEFVYNKTKFLIGMLGAVFSLMLCIAFGGSVKAGILFFVCFLVFAPFNVIVKEEKIKNLYCLILVLFSPMYYIFLMQLLPNIGLSRIGIYNILLNILCCEIIFGVLYLIIMKIRASVLVSGILILIFSTVNYYVYEFRVHHSQVSRHNL